jgi:hypothetical protein
MPVDVYEDSIDIHIDLVDALPIKPGEVLPRLSIRNERESRRFRTIVLENEYLRLIFVPALGGRLWSLFDKRPSGALFAPGEAYLCSSELRGASLICGITVGDKDGDRMNALGNVDSLLIPPDEESGEASVLLSEIVSFGPVSHSMKWTLVPGSAVIRLEVSVHNRSNQYADFEINTLADPSIHVSTTFENAWVGGGLAVLFEPGTFCGEADDRLSLVRRRGQLGPRQVDSYAVHLVPFFGVNTVTFVDRCGVGSLYQNEFLFDATEPMLGHKLLIQTETGETFEAPVDIHPEKTYRVDFKSVPGTVVAAQLKNADNHVAATVEGPKEFFESKSIPDSPSLPMVDWKKLSDNELHQYSAHPAYRAASFTELAARATARQQFALADACYEQVLLFNGDDPLTWWAKAVNKRLGGLDQGQERTELLNAHFLSPLEPCLRAEAFLSQPQTHGKEPSPLLNPLHEVPESFIEVACQLIDAGMYIEAGRWIEEAVRHVDFGMLHYLAAALYLEHSQMKMEAAQCIAKGNRGQWPPAPYRNAEKNAIQVILEAFPNDPILNQRLRV